MIDWSKLFQTEEDARRNQVVEWSIESIEAKQSTDFEKAKEFLEPKELAELAETHAQFIQKLTELELKRKK